MAVDEVLDTGAEKLASQPQEASGNPVKGKMRGREWEALRLHCEGRLAGLRTWRNTWWIQNWSDLSRFILPRRSIWLTQSAGGLPVANGMARGLEINEAIVDPTATFCVRVCAGGLMSGLASPSRPWFKLVPAVKNFSIDEEARRWFDDVEDIVYTVLAGSNFYNSFAALIKSSGVSISTPI